MPEENSKRRAVIVGINEYKDTKIPKLKGAQADAEELCKMLQELGDFKIPDEHRLIGEDATCLAIREAISDVFYQTNKCDLALFYFSGHGRELDYYDEGYICPYDMDFDNPLVYGIRMSELQQVISRSVGPANADCAVAILDCCYSGIATKDKNGQPSKADLFDRLTSGFKQVKGGQGFYMLASSGETEKSREVTVNHKGEETAHTHGAFTFHLLEGLAGEAAHGEETIFLGPLYDYAYNQLKGKTQEPRTCSKVATGMNTIPIARNLKIIDKKIEGYLLTIKECYSGDDPYSIFFAVPKVDYILKYNKNHVDALKYKQQINDALPKYKGSGDWLGKKITDIEPRIKYAFLKLEPFIDEVKNFPNFDRITELDSITRTLLANLFHAKIKNLSPDEFVALCTPINDEIRNLNQNLENVDIAKRSAPMKS